MDIAYSVDGVPIRLTYERWFHIVENHDDLSGYYDDVLNVIENPDMVLRGHRGSLIAISNSQFDGIEASAGTFRLDLAPKTRLKP